MTTTAVEQRTVTEEQRAAFITAGWFLKPHPAGGGWYAEHPELGQVPMYDSVARVMDAALERSEQGEVLPAPAAPLGPLDLPPGGNPAIDPDCFFSLPEDIPEHGLIRIQQIVRGRWQPRTTFDAAKIAELAASIEANGFIGEVKVFLNEEGDYELIGGERRTLAARQAGLTAIPAHVLALPARAAMHISVVDNLQREDLTPIEEGTAYDRLMRFLGISESALSKELGVSRTRIQQRLQLVAAAPELRNAVAADELTISQARGIIAGSGGDMAVQQEATKWVLQHQSSGHHVAISEASAREYASGRLLDRHRASLQKLGWTFTSVWNKERYVTMICSGDEYPRQWGGREILEAVTEKRKPAEQVERTGEVLPQLDDIIRLPLLATGITWNLNSAHYPWIRVTFDDGRDEWMKLGGLATLAAERETMWSDLKKRYSRWGLELRQSHRDLQVYRDGKPTRHLNLQWPMALALMDRVEAGELTAAVEFEVDDAQTEKQVKVSLCLTPDCKGKPVGRGQGHQGYGLYCHSCLEAFEEDRKEEKATVTELVFGAMEGVFEALDDNPVAVRLMTLLLCRMDQREDVLKSKPETLRKRLPTEIMDRLWGTSGTHGAAPITRKILGIEEEQAS